MDRFFEDSGKFYWRGVKSGKVFGGPFDTKEEAEAHWKSHTEWLRASLSHLEATTESWAAETEHRKSLASSLLNRYRRH